MTPKTKSRIQVLLIVAIILLGWSLALARLGERSLWADEGAAAYQALHTNSLSVALKLHKEYHFLHLALLMVVVRLSKTEFFLRFPSAMAAVMALAVVYVLGRQIFSRSGGLVAAFLLAISPFVLAYAQEARAYALLELLACLSLLVLVLALARRRWYWWAGFVVSTTLLLYTHFFAWFAVGAEVLFALIFLLWHSATKRKLDPRLLGLAASLLGIAVLYLPLISPLLAFVGKYGPGGSATQTAGLKPFQLSLTFIRDLVAVYGPWIYGWQVSLFAASFALGVGSLALRKKWPTLLLILLWFTIPLVILSAVSSQHFFDYRYLIFFVPVLLLVAAEGVATVGMLLAKAVGASRASRFYAAWAVGLAVLLFVPANLPALQRRYSWETENWRDIGIFIHDNLMPDEAIYVTPALWARPLEFYQPSLEPILVAATTNDPEQLPRMAAQHAGLWYVRYVAAFADPTGKLSEWISAQHFDLLIDGDACSYGIHVYYRRFDELGAARQAELLRQAAVFCPTDPRFQSPPP